MVRPENEEIVEMEETKMLAAGITGPEGHAMAHCEEAEVKKNKSFLMHFYFCS